MTESALWGRCATTDAPRASARRARGETAYACQRAERERSAGRRREDLLRTRGGSARAVFAPLGARGVTRLAPCAMGETAFVYRLYNVQSERDNSKRKRESVCESKRVRERERERGERERRERQEMKETRARLERCITPSQIPPRLFIIKHPFLHPSL
jgi:hypothetical protein